MSEREVWGSRIGLILAMAGNAVGLGNFLRFPVQAAQNGGGAFMIPYFIAFLLMAVPLMWVEWTIGRHGGKYNHGSLPGMFDSMWKHPISKYLGVFGIFAATSVLIYYTYVISWTAGFSFFSITQQYFGIADITNMDTFLKSYQGANDTFFNGIGTSYIFLLITFGSTFYVLFRGINKGIEILAKIAMPLLILFGLFLAIWVFTVGTPNPDMPEQSVAKGFAFIWNPNLSQLSDAKIWLAAAGQVFFTLSVGMGTLHTYASYLREKNDIALSGLTTASINEFTEVVIGGSIAIPIAVAFFGVTMTISIANGGSYNLGFVSMAVIFQQIPYGQYIGFLWFMLLFFAGITSSVAMAQPMISFLKEQFDISHKKATLIIGITAFVIIQYLVFFLEYGALDEFDYWAGTFSLVIVALLEVIIFGWIFGMDKAWKELNYGADIKVPRIFYYIIKYVTPLYLIVILVFWTIEDAIPTLMMYGIPEENTIYRWVARGILLTMFIGMTILVHFAWKRNSKFNKKEASNV
jgi:NSS family neurotransmitter:Na+ symporter